MSINGEAIYGTSRWIVNHEGPTMISMEGTDAREKVGFNTDFKPEDFWFTRKDNKLYAIALAYPKGTSQIRNLGKKTAGKIRQVRMLGSEEAIIWNQRNNGLEVTMPEQRPCKYGYALEITK
jgi:alpha-L-fucosidase